MNNRLEAFNTKLIESFKKNEIEHEIRGFLDAESYSYLMSVKTKYAKGFFSDSKCDEVIFLLFDAKAYEEAEEKGIDRDEIDSFIETDFNSFLKAMIGDETIKN